MGDSPQTRLILLMRLRIIDKLRDVFWKKDRPLWPPADAIIESTSGTDTKRRSDGPRNDTMGRDSPRKRKGKPALPKCSDGELLSRFLATHDEVAFTALMERHKGMVYGVCWRVLHHRQDAEAAFQNAFLVLMRKAASIREKESVGSWLHGAALHEAMAIRRKRGRRRIHECSCESCELAQLGQPLDAMISEEVKTLVRAELQRLPGQYRDALILHYLEEKSKAEIAEELGLKEGTVSSRLVKARKLLKARLRPYGFALSSG